MTYQGKITAHQDERRSHDRVVLMTHPGLVSIAGAKPVEMPVHNISALGFMVDCAERAPEGSHGTRRVCVTLQMGDHGPYNAIVRWSFGGHVGCSFDRPLSPTELLDLWAAHGGEAETAAPHEWDAD